jgi:hypothetical protein
MKVKFTLKKTSNILKVEIWNSPNTLDWRAHQNSDESGRWIIRKHRETNQQKAGRAGMFVHPDKEYDQFTMNVGRTERIDDAPKWIANMKKSFPALQKQIKAQKRAK